MIPRTCYHITYDNLTPREEEVYQILMKGKSPLTASRELGISYYTARKHLSNILEKTACRSHIELLATAVQALEARK